MKGKIMFSEITQLLAMIQMQKKLDQDLFATRGMRGYEDIPVNGYQSALLAEIGELFQETKPEWCWWKTPVPINRDKVLEEFVDCVHFVLSHAIFQDDIPDLVSGFTGAMTGDGQVYITDLIEGGYCAGTQLYRVTKHLGFTWNDVYLAYKKKNAINHSRQRAGY